MRWRNFESLNLVRALPVTKSAWVTARVGAFPQISTLAPYWIELRDDVLLLYSATQLWHHHKLSNSTLSDSSAVRRTRSLALTSELQQLSQTQISNLTHRVSRNHIAMFLLETTKIISREDSTAIALKSRHHRLSARLHFDNSSLITEWRHILMDTLSRDRKRLSSFDIVRHVGKGASGRVYQVEDKTTKEKLALKVIEKATVFESEDAYRHAMDERIVLQMIREHPFILDMRYAFQNAKRLFIVTEFCGGGDMFEFMNRKVAPLDEKMAKYVAAEVLLAIEHLHKFGVVYRDLKLENILVDDDGHTRLADFGLTKVLKKEDGTLERTSTFCGTREYVAPEMLRGEPYDTTIDFWTYGILLYEMLSGRTPFYTSDHSEIYKRIEKAPIYYPRNLSAEVRSLLGSLLQRDPTQRLGSGKHGLDDIKNHEWFSTIDWEALKNRRQGESPLKNTVTFFAKEDAKKRGGSSSGKKNRRQQKQEKALSALLADINEDKKFASFSSVHTSQNLKMRALSPRRTERMLAGYAFYDETGSGLSSARASSFVTDSPQTEERGSNNSRGSVDSCKEAGASCSSSIGEDESRKESPEASIKRKQSLPHSPTGIQESMETHEDGRVELAA